MKKINTRTLTVVALSVALAMVLSFVESLIPPLAAVPGVKLGLANTVTVFLLYTLGAKCAGGVSLIRICLSSLLFGSVLSLAYSLAGGILSFAAMLLLRRIGFFSSVGVSVVGGVMHNVGQIIVATLVMETAALALYLPVLIISGTAAGIAVGIISGILTERLKDKLV